ncbi:MULTISPECIES: aminoacyl-tRNA hydrolase [Mesorhizobium]|uniref:Peptidyl-tRNA hydrolase n=5 Tax=Mesorhizobium TaxID=68287 RepID=PTH_RHILO|nr:MULTISPECIES: aminoacyl-tRNA hydrolase [Mesorhizobium]Q98HV6.1 RecName: Full=Peptidyl-tRNA hydrolase; Short=PTH [Mesorhizobium japonicum MAFF 303099]MBE1706388.1 aminoacyl-tRNA hydrolase [Mesorhizobium japonicum]MBE1715101.1 aminoacyl-tRNA hydrolase [Mesorhizobium japonicum]MUT21689.1 aminoacyl-tRNA hydrolase [Mesorhizobium japonicum]MUT27540.1 aminoacyl-tRNA hydrolase [Mesorhizobium japonicum]OBP74170.1 aminoacyl-tRNA hydrolase [Mesorhizobium loti]
MLVFAGLGNPGAKYADNRHNVGFMAADAIARRHSFSPWSKKFQGLIAEGTIAGEKIILIKPQTFMNLSGQSVGEALRFYKLELSALTVFYDEIDLAEGKLRIKTGGGAGGHNGIRSIDGHIGNAYRRVRIGVGHPGIKEMVQHHVLGDFAKADREWLDPLLDAIADNAAMIVKGDESGFMNKAALAVQGKAIAELEKPAQKQQPKQQSHIRQARSQQAPAKLPETGPMAAMLKKLFGNKD